MNALYPHAYAAPKRRHDNINHWRGGVELLEGIKYPEGNFFIEPIFGGVAKHIEQGLAGIFIELGRAWKLLYYNNKTLLRSGLVGQPGQAVGQGVEISGMTFWQAKRLCDGDQHLLLRGGFRAMSIQEMLTEALGLLL